MGTDNKLKKLRKEKKETQSQIAKLMGVNVKTISRWENGKFEIKPPQAQMLAKYFGVSVAHLLGYDEELELFDNGTEFKKARQKLLDEIEEQENSPKLLLESVTKGTERIKELKLELDAVLEEQEDILERLEKFLVYHHIIDGNDGE